MKELTALVGILAAILVGGCGDSPSAADCPSHFDTRDWRQAGFDSDRKLELALQIEDCGFLKNANKSKVRALLGPPRKLEEQYPAEFRREWYYRIGEVFGEGGPAQEQALEIMFDGRGRVRYVAVNPKAE